MEQAEADAVAALLSAAASGDIAPVDKGVEIAEEPSGARRLRGGYTLPPRLPLQCVVLKSECLHASWAGCCGIEDTGSTGARLLRAAATLPVLSACGRWAEREPEYLVKWLGRAHMHDEWVGEALLGRLAKRKLVNFKRRHGGAPCMLADPAWRVPERLVARRPAQAGPGWELLVKWTGLGYESATWEARARPGS